MSDNELLKELGIEVEKVNVLLKEINSRGIRICFVPLTFPTTDFYSPAQSLSHFAEFINKKDNNG